MAQDVTSVCAPKISNFLQKNKIVSTLSFPSISRLIYAYHSSHYREAGKIIAEGKIEIYRSNKSGLAQYKITGDSAIIIGNDVDDDNRNGVVVHEVTHMIQDMRKLKLSILEMELDAYFAEALYYVRRGMVEAFEDNKPMMIGIHMARIAQNFEDDERYLKTRDFRKRRGEISKEILNEYYYRHGRTDLGKRFRNDGLQL